MGSVAKITLSPAREAAFKIIYRVEKNRSFCRPLLDNFFKRSKLSFEDNAFVNLIVIGVVSTSGTLDELINESVYNHKDIKLKLRICLRLATYELFFLRKDAYISVSQGVELTKKFVPKAYKFANYSLNRISEMRELFPFYKEKYALARKYGFPNWMYKMISECFGYEQAENFMKISNQQAPIYLAHISLKDRKVPIELKQFCEQDKDLQSCYKLKKASDLKMFNHFISSGRVLVADKAVQLICQKIISACECNFRILEIGSGRGNKSILLQDLAFRRFGKQMQLACVEFYQNKISQAKARMYDYGVNVEDYYKLDASKKNELNKFENQYDFVFIDAPCSGLGTLRRHPEIRWRICKEDIQNLCSLQAKLLMNSFIALKKIGFLAYSTCTINNKENSAQIDYFVSKQKSFDVVIQKNFSLKTCSHDAHFLSILKNEH